MSETANKSKEKEFRKLLKSGREDVILDTLQKLRDEGSKELIKDVANLYLTNPGELLSRTLDAFFNDLKEQDCVVPVMEFLMNNKEMEYIKNMVCSCWQNGLDYSGYIPFFTEMVLFSDYETSIEAFTVVEENIDSLNPGSRNEILDEIKKSLSKIPEEKLALVSELQSVVGNVSGPFQVDFETPES